MLSKAAPAAVGRGVLRPVDETAITLKLRPLRRRDRFPFLRHWRIAAAATLVGLTAAALLFVDRPEPEPDPGPRRIAVTTPSPDPEPVLASATLPVLEPLDEGIAIVDDELDEIVIFEEPVEPPAPAPTRASTRARARSIAREHTSQGQTALSMGDLETARRELAAALTALPSHAPAAAAMAELHMKQRRYGSALRFAKRASRSAPRKLDYMLLLGDAYLLADNRGAARKAWRKAAAYGSAKAQSRLAG
jgi:tetratricopeptide (TPR) repeat protein